MKNFDGYLKLKLGNDYVLLAGGSHKALSDFLMSSVASDTYVKKVGDTMSGPLKLNGSPSQSDPPLQINYTSDFEPAESTIGLLKFGKLTTHDMYLGIAPTTKTHFGRVGYFMHVNTNCEFTWASSSWTNLMALTGGTGNLWVKGTVTASEFLGNATTASYPYGFTSRGISDWSGVDGTLATDWSVNGADIMFKYDGSKLNVITDGRFYQGIDIYGASKRCLDEYDISNTKWGDADSVDGYHFSDLENRYVNITGDTMTGGLNLNSTPSNSQPCLTIHYESTFTASDDSIRLMKFGHPLNHDMYLGIGKAAYTHFGKDGYFMHANNGCEFTWATTSWTNIMALEASSGNLWVKGSVTANGFIGNATTSSYPLGFSGRQNTNNWPGVAGHTLLTAWQDTTKGGEIAFLTNGSGQVSVAVDGFFYQGIDSRGNHRVVDTYDLESYYTKTVADDRFVNVTGDTMTDALKINASPSTSNPPLQVCYTSTYTADDSSIGLIKFGAPTYDNYLGVGRASRTHFGKVCYFMHTDNACEFDWVTSNWTLLMALEASSGNLWVKNSVTCPSFIGNATTCTYPLGFTGRLTNNNWINNSDQTFYHMFCWLDGYGGELGFWSNHNGQVFMAIDGAFYQRRDSGGCWRVADVHDLEGYILKTGDTMTGPLKINCTPASMSAPSLAINYTSDYSTTADTIMAHVKFGNTGTDCYLGNAPATRTYYGLVGYAYHVDSACEFDWFTSGWTKLMALRASNGNLWVKGNVTAPNFYTTSDACKKQNISSFSEHIRKFQLKDTEKWHYGVIAQEVPEMFRDGEEGNMTVNYNSILSFYIGLLENRVKELEEKIKLLETK